MAVRGLLGARYTQRLELLWKLGLSVPLSVGLVVGLIWEQRLFSTMCNLVISGGGEGSAPLPCLAFI